MHENTLKQAQNATCRSHRIDLFVSGVAHLMVEKCTSVIPRCRLSHNVFYLKVVGAHALLNPNQQSFTVRDALTRFSPQRAANDNDGFENTCDILV